MRFMQGLGRLQICIALAVLTWFQETSSASAQDELTTLVEELNAARTQIETLLREKAGLEGQLRDLNVQLEGSEKKREKLAADFDRMERQARKSNLIAEGCKSELSSSKSLISTLSAEKRACEAKLNMPPDLAKLCEGPVKLVQTGLDECSARLVNMVEPDRYNRVQSLLETCKASLDRSQTEAGLQRDRANSCEGALTQAQSEVSRQQASAASCSAELDVCKRNAAAGNCERRIEYLIGDVNACGIFKLNLTDGILSVVGQVASSTKREEVLSRLSGAYPDVRIDAAKFAVSEFCRKPVGDGEIDIEMGPSGPVFSTKFDVDDRGSLVPAQKCPEIGQLIDRQADSELPLPRRFLERFWIESEGDLLVCKKDGTNWRTVHPPTGSTDKLPIFRMDTKG